MNHKKSKLLLIASSSKSCEKNVLLVTKHDFESKALAGWTTLWKVFALFIEFY